MKLYSHQSKFLEKNPDRAILSWEAGIGKTRAACEWMKLRSDKPALVICTKATKQKWLNDLIKWDVKHDVLVVTKEEFKKPNVPIRSVVVVDECQNVSSPLYLAKDRSQLSEKLFYYLKQIPDLHIILMSANIVRSSPWNIHTIATFARVPTTPFWRDFQNKYFQLIMRPYLPRPAWEPRKGWQKDIQKTINSVCDVAIMKDCVDVPVHEHQIIDIPLTKASKQAQEALLTQEWEPMTLWTGLHRLENGSEKLAYIKELGEGVKKMIVVCHYRMQIGEYAKELSKQKQVFVLHGGIKDQHQVIQDAQEAEECYFIIQAAMTAGYDLDKFSVMIFASMSYKYVDFSQALGRINRIHNLHRNRYIYLVAGEHDKAILETLEKGKDFDPSEYICKNYQEKLKKEKLK